MTKMEFKYEDRGT